MNSPSRYGGIAAVMVMGIGALIVGFTMPPQMHDRAVSLRWIGAALVVMGITGIGVVASQSVSRRALFIAIASVIYCGMFIYNAVSAQLSGTATYHTRYFGKGDVPEQVTLAADPAKFHTAVTMLWVGSAVCLAVGIGGLLVYRSDFE